VQVGAVHRKACDALAVDAQPGLARTAQALFFLRQAHGAAPYFFFVSFSTTRSPA
jgi:hypothetical protein